MTLLLTPAKVDAVIRNARWWMFGGIGLMILALNTHGFGLISAVMGISLGACGGTFGGWRDDKGLWMLSCLFFVLFLLIYVGCALGHLSDIIHHRGNAFWLIIDFSVAGQLLWMQLRFLLTVTARNWRLTHK